MTKYLWACEKPKFIFTFTQQINKTWKRATAENANEWINLVRNNDHESISIFSEQYNLHTSVIYILNEDLNFKS